MPVRCISFDSYIKPRRFLCLCWMPVRCISFDSYIKPQQKSVRISLVWVVYLLTPTSNHNITTTLDEYKALYIFWLLHQTTTLSADGRIGFKLYIFWLLHQTTTLNTSDLSKVKLYIFWLLHQTTTWTLDRRKTFGLYIFWLLHQTTTRLLYRCGRARCISFDSYIKPQLYVTAYARRNVVYLLTPTSNHNGVLIIAPLF